MLWSPNSEAHLRIDWVAAMTASTSKTATPDSHQRSLKAFAPASVAHTSPADPECAVTRAAGPCNLCSCRKFKGNISPGYEEACRVRECQHMYKNHSQ